MKALIKTYPDQDWIDVETKYHDQFPRRAKELGGKWTGSAWRFPSNQMDEVKELIADVYPDTEITVLEACPAHIAEVERVCRAAASWPQGEKAWKVWRSGPDEKSATIYVVRGPLSNILAITVYRDTSQAPEVRVVPDGLPQFVGDLTKENLKQWLEAYHDHAMELFETLHGEASDAEDLREMILSSGIPIADILGD